jgi:hypothetical protein
VFTRNDLDELLAIEAQPALSIYLPTHVAGREIRQDPIRLKNLTASLARRLAEQWRRPAVEALLAPAQALIKDENFWRHQQSGLALFLAPDFERMHHLPIAVSEEALLGLRFHIRPLLPLIEDEGQFWLLTISEARTCLYKASRWHCAAVSGVDLPQGIGEVRNESLYQETKYGAPEARQGPIAHTQTLGESPHEVHKTELLRLLQRIAAAVEPCLKRQPRPLVVAAQPQILGHFLETVKAPDVLGPGLAGNPDSLSAEELRQRAYALVEPREAAARGAALSRLEALRGTGQATSEATEIVTAACEGRIDTLLLDRDHRIWGRFDDAGGRAIVHDPRGEDDVDLLDYAAALTLRHGGAVLTFDPSALPTDERAAAILRY